MAFVSLQPIKTQVIAIQDILGQPQPRISELLNGKINRVSIEKLMDYLRGWLVNHIQASDRAYVPTLTEAGAE